MASLVNSDILRLVARLVLGYLDEQNLPDAYTVFCETSRHLTKEYLAYKEGAKSIDTSIGLVNIISEYFLLKEKLNEFIRTCPKTTLIIQLIDTSSIQLRLELIFKILKDNLVKIDGNPIVEAAISRKRRKDVELEGFNVSQSNASTPESSQPMKKRRKISLTTPFISVSASNNNNKQVSADKSVLNRKELNYISSPETSNKEEDDVTEEEQKPEIKEEVEKPQSAKISLPPLEILSETVLKKTDFVENLAEFINQTRSAKELLDSTEPSTSQTALTQIDVQDILSKTEPDFEDILKEVIDKYLDPSEGNQSTENDVTPSKEDIEEEGELKPEEIPLKQRLRQRSAKKATPASEKKKKKKFNIISNEPYTGPLPACLNNLPSTSAAAAQLIPQFIEQPQTQSIIVSLVPIIQNGQFIPFQTIASSSPVQAPESSQQIVLEAETQPSPIVDLNKENEPSEKPHQTPKVSGIPTSFLESKCKSTPRRKATHVRILDFNQTPRLSTLKEFSTPTGGIKMDTPGSAPPALLTEQRPTVSKKVINEEAIEIVDDSSNSTSISNTPKVAKNRRQRKIAIDTKKVEESPAKEPPMTREEWIKMREEQKSLSLDERIRMMVSKENEKGDADRTKKKKKKKTPKKKVAVNVEVKLEGKSDKQTTSKKTPLTRISSGAKFKVTSPRKAALLRKTPNKKKKLSKSPVFSITNILTPNIDVIKQRKVEEKKNEEKQENKKDENSNEAEKQKPEIKKPAEKETPQESDMNRSESVLEVANLLTHFPETILAKTNSSQNLDDKIDPNILLETPLKLDTSMSPLPNTPRFAVPLVTTSTHETPMPKAIVTTTSASISSIVKICDILTPSFPITPGFKETPIKSDHSPTSGGGYSSRRTDYSSCSSYYKPDESEDINQNLDIIIKQSRERNSQSESDGAVTIEHSVKIRVGSAKKVECPAALDRVHSFTEVKKEIPVPHYTMMDEGLLSESIITTASSDNDSSSSSFTCSTCSTDSSTADEVSVDIFNQSEIPEVEDDGRDLEWHCKEVENEVAESNNSLIDEKTGELRFPLRNLMTPRKVEQEIKSIIGNVQEVKEVPKESKPHTADLEAIKQRTLRILKNESSSRKPPPKHKKSNEKAFKLPIEQPKSIPQTRREQILNRNLTERSRATPLILSSSSSSSRRKNATPRKTIVIDELPKAPSPIKKQRKARAKSESTTTTTTKPERVSLENISDNAVMNDDHPSLNISNSFEESAKPAQEEESNTFQKAMIEQGFDKNEAKILCEKFDKKENVEDEKEEGEMTESDEEEECVFAFADTLQKNIVNMKESTGERVKKSYQPLSKFPPAKLKVDEKTIKIDFSEVLEIFSMEPVKKVDDKKQERRKELERERERERERTREREKSRKKIPPKSMPSKDTNGRKEKTNESKHLVNDVNIEKVLSLIHGNK